jgi:hypothetical protein
VDQFDVRIDYHVSSSTQLFGRYSFVDSNVFRPAPLPGLAEGSYSDAFGSNDNRSQGIALGLTRVFTNSLAGDFRLGWNRGDYFSKPPNVDWRSPENRSSRVRRDRPAHFDAAISDAADVESAHDFFSTSRQAFREGWIRVPEDPD